MSDLIGIGGTLLSGLGGRSARKAEERAARRAEDVAVWERKNAIADQAASFQRHREASEAAGFNPLATLGATGAGMIGQTSMAVTPASSNNYMGSAIADSAILLSQSLARTKAAQQGRTVEDLRRQRDILSRKLTQQAIRPKVPGVYATRTHANVVPNVGMGNGNSRFPNAADTVPRALASQSWTDPRREVDNKPVTTTSGFMEVDSPYLLKSLKVPTLDGDEPLQWYDYPSLIVPGGILAGELFYDHYKATNPYARNGGKPGVSIPDGAYRKPFPRPGSEDAFNHHMGRHRPYPAYSVGWR